MKIVSRVIINRPVKEVWNFFDNVENLGKWLKDFVKFEHISGIRGQVGAKARQYYIENGKEIHFDEIVTARKENSLFSGIISNNMMEAHINNIFTDVGDGRTEVECQMDVRFKSFYMKHMAPLISGVIHKRLDEQYNRLKAAIEADA